MEMTLIGVGLIERGAALAREVGALPEEERAAVLNLIRQALHEVSPFRAEPVDCILWVPADQIAANSYNPNTVAAPEMRLLEHSITEDGYTQPLVTWQTDPVTGQREVVDGFHRYRVGTENEAIRDRLHARLPVTTINAHRTDRSDRIAATIRHNRARGKHEVVRMSEIVLELCRRNWSEAKIGRELGMEPDEVLRLAQIGGLADLFADREFSEAWEANPK